MKIAVISDLHGNLPNYNLEGVELLLICGDFSPLRWQSDIPTMMKWLAGDFTEWCLRLNVPKIIFIAGNHDWIAERCNSWMHHMFTKSYNITYLCNESYDYISEQDGHLYTIFGTPYCKQFGNWAFMRDSETLKKKFSEIPINVDILLSHDAPKIDKLGCINQEGFAWYKTDAGNQELADVIRSKQPMYSFCGHIHSGNHSLTLDNGVLLANTSIVNEQYKITYDPLIVDIYPYISSALLYNVNTHFKDGNFISYEDLKDFVGLKIYTWKELESYENKNSIYYFTEDQIKDFFNRIKNWEESK